MKRARLVVSILTALSSSGFVALAACSEDEAKPPVDGGDEIYYAPKKDTGVPASDATEDAPVVKPPPPTIPGCVGTAIPLKVAGERAYVDVHIGPKASVVDAGEDAMDAWTDGDADAEPLDTGPIGSNGEFVVDFGTTFSTIDFGGFDTPPAPTYCNGDAAAPGADCTFQGFDFFGDWGQVWLRTADYSGIQALKRQAGILATDFLALNPFTMDYTRGQIWRSDPATFCTDAQLLGAGFMPLPSDGFYATDLSKLRPLSDVIIGGDASISNFTVPNVPTVPIQIAGVSALAQLDTGYDDRLIRHSINVNEALFKIIEEEQKGKQRKLERDELADVFLTTCVPGYNEKVLAYRLAEGETFDFIASGGSVARRETTIALFVKEKSDVTAKCGGISTWTVPAAQIGASFYVDAQALIFDPKSSRVWIPKK